MFFFIINWYSKTPKLTVENAALSQRSDPLKDCRELTTIELNRAHLHISPGKHIYVFGIAGTIGYGFDVIPPRP